MSIPSEKDIEIPLLQEIEAAGGGAKPSELYDKVAKHFPHLTLDDQQAKHPRTGIPIWRNRVQWARQHLVNKGEVDASVRGIWHIIEKGRARLTIIADIPEGEEGEDVERQKEQELAARIMKNLCKEAKARCKVVEK